MDPKGKSGDQTTAAQNQNMQLSKDELDRVTEVFKMYETGLREATIYPKVRKSNLSRILNWVSIFCIQKGLT